MINYPHFPWEVEWSVTWSCNVRCCFCSTGKYDRALHAKDVESIADRIIAVKPFTVTLSGGEPLVHPQIDYVVDKFLSADLMLNLTTNGLLLSRLTGSQLAQLNWTRISVHSAFESTSMKIMGSAYNAKKAKEGIGYLKKYTGKFSIFTLITPENCNETEMAAIMRFTQLVGAAKLEIGVVKLLGWANTSMLIPKERLEKLFAYISEEAQRLRIDVHLPDMKQREHYCSARKRNAAILPDGEVRSCSFDLDSRWGNLLSESLEDIWIRRKKLDNRCDRCAPGGYLNDSPIASIRLITQGIENEKV